MRKVNETQSLISAVVDPDANGGRSSRRGGGIAPHRVPLPLRGGHRGMTKTRVGRLEGKSERREAGSHLDETRRGAAEREIETRIREGRRRETEESVDEGTVTGGGGGGKERDRGRDREERGRGSDGDAGRRGGRETERRDRERDATSRKEELGEIEGDKGREASCEEEEDELEGRRGSDAGNRGRTRGAAGGTRPRGAMRRKGAGAGRSRSPPARGGGRGSVSDGY